MRKTRKCAVAAIKTLNGRLLARTCDLGRDHEGDFHHDDHGAWRL
jgi:hypothetical protein